METLVARCAGLDVHKDSVTACVRVPDGQGGRQVETRRFTTTTAGLGRMAGWLAERQVALVAMEATGVYWKPIVRHEVPRVRAEVEGLRRRPVAAGR
jgi:transposase